MKVVKDKIVKNKDIIIIVIAIIILSILKQCLVQGFPIVAYVMAGEDDALMVKFAYSILEGKWLGEYTYNTLMKGPSFPMLLALLYRLKLPYIFSITSLYTISCIVFMIGNRKMIKNKYVFIVFFAILLFNPIMYGSNIIQRIYRNSLIPSFALLIIGSYIALFLRRNEKTRYSIIWSLIAGISLGTFYYTREDSMWIIPFILFITASIIISKIITEKKINLELISKIIIISIPIICLMLFGKYISLKNEEYYGLRTKNVLTESNFTAALKSIYSVRPEKIVDSVTVTQEKVDRMAEISPSFATIAPKLHETIGSFGKLDRKPDDSEVEDGWVLWAIRIAVMESGYKTFAAEQDIYAKIANELNQAMEKGLLERQRVMPSAMMSPYRKEYTLDLLKTLGKCIKFVATFDTLSISNTDVSTDNEALFDYVKSFENISRERSLYPEDSEYAKETEQAIYIESLNIRTSILNGLVRVYCILGIISGIVGIIYYIVLTVTTIKEIYHKKYNNIEKWIIISALLGALFTLIVGVSYNHVATCYSIMYLYLCGAYPIYIAFSSFCVYNAVIEIMKQKNCVIN